MASLIPKNYGFTLIEVMVTIVIIGLLAVASVVFLTPLRAKARDTKRIYELSQIGRFFSLNCYLPDSGAGVYDVADLIKNFKSDNRYQGFFGTKFADPKSGNANRSNYTYIVTSEKKCVLYANLENAKEKITLPDIDTPTPGGGTGVFASSTEGVNGTTIYYQVSN